MLKFNPISGTLDSYPAQTETDPTVPAWAKTPSKPTYTKSEVGLSNVNNTSDADKIISTATQTALDGKFTQRTITGTTNQITVTNGDGVSGNPTLSLPQNIHTGASPTFAGATLTGKLYLNSTAYLDGATAGTVGISGRVDTSDSGPSSGSGDYLGFSQYVTCSGTYSGALFGGSIRVARNVSGKWLVGYKYNPLLTGSADLTGKMSAFYAVPEHAGTGTIAEMYGAEVQPYITSTGGVTTYIGMRISNASGSGTGTFGTYNGMTIYDPSKTVTGTLTGLYIRSLLSGATNYAIYTNTGLVRFGDSVTLADGKDISTGTTTGMKIGTATNQKLGFFNATPVVQPASTPANATDLATALTLVNNLKSKLITLGLIA